MAQNYKVKFAQIARDAQISPQSLTNIIKGRRGASWPACKRLEKATGISAVAWIEGRVDRNYLNENYDPFKSRRKKLRRSWRPGKK